jgi:hypothetical protein
LLSTTPTPGLSKTIPRRIDFLGYGPLNVTIDTYTEVVETVPALAGTTPEPSTFVLLGAGIAFLGFRKPKNRQHSKVVLTGMVGKRCFAIDFDCKRSLQPGGGKTRSHGMGHWPPAIFHPSF